MPLRTQHSGRSGGARSRTFRPSVEGLEDRMVLAAAINPVIDMTGLAVGEKYASDHILVRYSGSPQSVLAGTHVGRAVDSAAGLYEVKLSSTVSVEAALAAYRASGAVALAEPDFYLKSNAIPNDGRFSDQWSLKNTGQAGGKVGADINAAQAWNVTTGSSRMVVSVMDTGVNYVHPDLYQNIWLNQGEIPASRRANLIDTNGDGLITFRDLNDARNQGAGKIRDQDGNGRIDANDLLRAMRKTSQGADTGEGGWADAKSNDGDEWVDDLVGWNFYDNNNKPMDDMGHGTHVAGTIGAMGNNGLGVSGINWTIQMMPIKFLGQNGGGSISDFITALNYAVAHGAKISNNSWTGSGDSQALADAIAAAKTKNHIFVAAAGNYGQNNDEVANYPSGFTKRPELDNVVSVAATNRNDALADFSNYGKTSVDLAAPGVGILSTTKDGEYGYNSGTSMATPAVTGVLALVWASRPSWTYKQVVNQVLSTVDKLPSLQDKTVTGGRLNASAAVGSVQVTSLNMPKVISVKPQGPNPYSMSSIRVTFDRAMALSSFTTVDAMVVGTNSLPITITGVRAVAGSGDRSFDVTFALQTKPGTYTVKIGPNIVDIKGVRMTYYHGTLQLPAAPKPTPTPTSTATKVTLTSTTPVTVPQKGLGVSLLTVNQDLQITDVNVTINVTHPRVGDLYVYLQGPDGTKIVLAYRVGGASANFTNTTFDDGAANNIAFGSTPFTGSFQPSVPLSNLNGKNARGNWKLWVEDRAGVAKGTITSWSLTITGRAMPA